MLYPIGWAPVGAAVGGANGVMCGLAGHLRLAVRAGLGRRPLDVDVGLIGITGVSRVHVVEHVPATRDYLDDLSRAPGPPRVRGAASHRGRSSRSPPATSSAMPATYREPDRRSLIEIHEGLHVWQQRWFGPLFLIVYGTVDARRLHQCTADGSRNGVRRGSTTRNVTRTTTTRSNGGRTARTTAGRPVGWCGDLQPRRSGPDVEREPRSPRNTMRPFHSSVSVASSRSGKRARACRLLPRPSSRARCAPRQEWTPPPNDMCSRASDARRGRARSAVGPALSGSRFAAPSAVISNVPASIVLPPIRDRRA